MFQAPIPVYNVTGPTVQGQRPPMPVFVTNAPSSGDVTQTQFYGYTGGSVENPPTPAYNQYETKSDAALLRADVNTMALEIQDIETDLANTASDTELTDGLALKANKAGDTFTGAVTVSSGDINCNTGTFNSKMTSGAYVFSAESSNATASLIFCPSLVSANLIRTPKLILAQPTGNSTQRTWTMPTTSNDVSFLHSGTNGLGQTVAGRISINENITSATGNFVATIGNFTQSITDPTSRAFVANSSSFSTSLIDAPNMISAGLISTPKLLLLQPGSNVAKRTWTMPTTLENVSFFHTGFNGGVQTINGSVNFENPLYVASNATTRGLYYAPSTCSDAIIYASNLTPAASLIKTASVSIQQPANAALRTWSLPVTTTNVDFVHTAGGQVINGVTQLNQLQIANNNFTITEIKGVMPATGENESILTTLAVKQYVDDKFLQLAGGTLTGDLVSPSLKIGTTKISSILTSMPGSPDDTQLLTAKAIKTAIPTGGSYLPLNGGTMTGTITFNDFTRPTRKDITSTNQTGTEVLTIGINSSNRSYISSNEIVCDEIYTNKLKMKNQFDTTVTMNRIVTEMPATVNADELITSQAVKNFVNTRAYKSYPFTSFVKLYVGTTNQGQIDLDCYQTYSYNQLCPKRLFWPTSANTGGLTLRMPAGTFEYSLTVAGYMKPTFPVFLSSSAATVEAYLVFSYTDFEEWVFSINYLSSDTQMTVSASTAYVIGFPGLIIPRL